MCVRNTDTMPVTFAPPETQETCHADTFSPEKYPKVLFLNFASDFSSQKQKKDKKPKQQNAYRVNGVNILNRTNVDSKTAIERIQRRRENHNYVERKRRDNISHTILELSKVIPNAAEPGQKLNKGKILQMALAHIQELHQENTALREKVASLSHQSSSPLPSTSSTPSTPSCPTSPTHTALPNLASEVTNLPPILPAIPDNPPNALNPPNPPFC